MIEPEGRAHREVGIKPARIVAKRLRPKNEEEAGEKEGPAEKDERAGREKRGREQAKPVKRDPDRDQDFLVDRRGILEIPDRGRGRKDEAGRDRAQGEAGAGGEEDASIAERFLPNEKGVDREDEGENGEPDPGEEAIIEAGSAGARALVEPPDDDAGATARSPPMRAVGAEMAR